MSKAADNNSNKHEDDEDDHDGAVYHLQVLQTARSAPQEDGEEGWQDAGPIRLWKDGAERPSATSSSTGAESSSASSSACLSAPRQLPKHAKAFLRLGHDAVPRSHIYLYRNAASQHNNNINPTPICSCCCTAPEARTGPLTGSPKKWRCPRRPPSVSRRCWKGSRGISARRGFGKWITTRSRLRLVLRMVQHPCTWRRRIRCAARRSQRPCGGWCGFWNTAPLLHCE